MPNPYLILPLTILLPLVPAYVLYRNLPGKAMVQWTYQNAVGIAFFRPDKLTDDGFVESSNGTLRAECLDIHWFTTLTETRQILESWRREWNESRLHKALGKGPEQIRPPGGC